MPTILALFPGVFALADASRNDSRVVASAFAAPLVLCMLDLLLNLSVNAAE